MLLLALFACTGMNDSRPNTDTEVVDEGSDTSGAVDSGETDWVRLPERCGEPASGTDPLTVVGSVFIQDFVTDHPVETVDVEVDPDTNIAWLVGQGGLLSVDLTDPTAPEYLFSRPMERFYNVELGPGTALYVTNRDRRLIRVYDRSEPRGPRPVREIRVNGPSGMAHTTDRLYMTTHAGSLITFDISDPFDPQEIHRLEGLDNPWMPHLLGERLYVADNSAGVVTISLADPDRPALVGTTPTQGGAQDLTFSDDGQTMYVAVGGAGIEAFSLADPDAPSSVWIEALNYSVISVAAAGDRLWATNQQDVVGYDIASPQRPSRINTEKTPHWAMHVATFGDRAVIADWGYLHILDLDREAAAPDAALVERAVYLEPGATTEVLVRNMGNASLEIRGAEAPPGRLLAEASQTTIAAGAEGRLRLTNTTTDTEADDVFTVCVATSDPDEPDQRITVLSSPPPNNGLGTDAPDFTLTGLDGETYTLSDQRGQPVVLAYFATW
ncbi:MAG: hypothetical protein AAFV53_15270 [Myxococcota bacterium]